MIRRPTRTKLPDTLFHYTTLFRSRTYLLQHDVSTPRPYSRINHVQGTRGAFRGYPDRLALVSVKEGEEWIEDLEPYREQFGSALWSRVERQAAALGGGHGGLSSDERRGGKECGRTVWYRGAPQHNKKK